MSAALWPCDNLYSPMTVDNIKNNTERKRKNGNKTYRKIRDYTIPSTSNEHRLLMVWEELSLILEAKALPVIQARKR